MAGTLVEGLWEMAAGGASAESVASAAAEWLGDAGRVASAFADPSGVMAGTVAAWHAFEGTCQSGWRRFPRMQAAGAHGASPDARAIQLFAAPTYLRDAGCYSGPELAAMAADGAAPPRWVLREGLRLRCLLVAVEALISELEKGAVAAPAFADAVRSIVQRFARMPIADTAGTATREHTSGG